MVSWVMVTALAGLLVLGASTASADDCSALGGAIVGNDCEVSTAVVASDAEHGGPFVIDRTLRITGSGRITVPELSGGNNLTLSIKGNLVMDVPATATGSRITGDASTGTAADISISTIGSILLHGSGNAGARISSSRTRPSCPAGSAGTITLRAAATFVAEAGSQVTSSSSCGTGEIVITAGFSATIDGLVAADGTTSTGRGGPITIMSGCDLSVGDTGIVRSQGQDPGADRVHLEGGCSVRIRGLVASTGPGHLIAPPNRCHGPQRPDKPADASACVEVWSGGALTIDRSSPHMGEVNADTAQSGGTRCCAWIDLFAAGDITIIGDTDGPYAVHANQFVSNGFGGIVTVKSSGGDVSASGSAIQASSSGAGGRGGEVVIEAAGDTTLAQAVIAAQGDAIVTGGYGVGGSVQARAFTGAVSWKKTAASTPSGDVQPTGSGVPDTRRGVVLLNSCSPIDLTGTEFPVTSGAPTTPTLKEGLCPPGQPDAPAFADYVDLPRCVCAGQADVSVTKRTTTPLVSPGESVSYNIDVVVTGGVPATNVVLTDTLPAGLGWTVGGPNAGACTGGPVLPGGSTLTCAFGTVNPGDLVSLTLTATAASGNCPTISNTASVTSDADDNPDNDSSGPIAITVRCSDVKVVKTAGSAVINAGANALYSVTVTANGPGSSNNVVMTDVLPAGLSWTVGGPDAAACSPASPVAGGTTLTCSFGLMASGATKTVTLTAATTTASCTAINNTATVTADGDGNAANNSSGPIVITVGCPDVSVRKTATASAVNVGATAGYSVVVTANGPGSSPNVTLTDVLPGGLTWTVSGPDAAACAPASPVTGGTTLTCLFGTMAQGSTRTITISAPTSPANCPSIANTATVTAGGDTNAGNNTSGPIAIGVICAPDIAVSKTTTTPSVNLGANASYGIEVVAGGTATSTGVRLVDVVPGPPSMSWTVSGGGASACSPNPVAGGSTLTCDFGTMAGGSARSIVLTAATTAAACGSLSNMATVTANVDNNLGNNSAGPVLIDVRCPNVSIAKTATTPVIQPGGVARYSITVTANGPGHSQDVALTDTLPVGAVWTIGGPHAAACTPTSPVPGGVTLTCNFGQLAPGETRTITLAGETALRWNFVGTNIVTGTAAGAQFTTAGRTVHVDAFVLGSDVANGTPAFVYGKDEGVGEQGVGICAAASGSPLVCRDPHSAHEIDANQDGFPGNNQGMLRVDLGAEFASLGHFSMNLGSVQAGETFRIFTSDSGSIATATLIYEGTSADDGRVVPISGVRRYLFVKAPSGDVLLQLLVAATCTPLVNTATVSASADANAQNDTSGPVAIAVTDCSAGLLPTFADVPADHPFFPFIEALAESGMTGGCSASPPLYCPEGAVTRAQMAVFLLRGLQGVGHVPPPPTGAAFADVSLTHPLAGWIEELANQGITSGCAASPPRYCPDTSVRRGEMAVFLLRAKHGAGYQPPAASGTVFADVPLSHPLAAWIEQLAAEGITTGCGAATFCPDATVSRGQTAVFLVRTFNLPL